MGNTGKEKAKCLSANLQQCIIAKCRGLNNCEPHRTCDNHASDNTLYMQPSLKLELDEIVL